jgi:hypothetical protein
VAVGKLEAGRAAVLVQAAEVEGPNKVMEGTHAHAQAE